jgi:hypothetical protein
MKKTIKDLLKEFNSGLEGIGPVLWHKTLHKNGSGEFACFRGILEKCKNVVDCDNCYSDKIGGYCLKDGQSNNGFLAVEYKHQKLVDFNAFGAYGSIREAISH